MRLPQSPRRRVSLLTASLGAALVATFTVASYAAAHPGPVDTSGGHYCTQAQNASGLCAPPTYHRHDPDGGVVVVTPGPEAAQLTGQQNTPTTAQPFAPGGTPSTALPAPAAAPPPGQDLASTGPISMNMAVLGALLASLGLIALFANQRLPLPVILELDRPAG